MSILCQNHYHRDMRCKRVGCSKFFLLVVYWRYIPIQGPLGILWMKLACVFCKSITREPCKWAVLCSHCRTWSQRSLCLAAGRRLSPVCTAVWRYDPKEQLIWSLSRTANGNNLSEPGTSDGSASKFCSIFMQACSVARVLAGVIPYRGWCGLRRILQRTRAFLVEVRVWLLLLWCSVDVPIFLVSSLEHYLLSDTQKNCWNRLWCI